MTDFERIVKWLKAKKLTPEQFAALLVIFTPKRG
jgi:hypothetical protein